MPRVKYCECRSCVWNNYCSCENDVITIADDGTCADYLSASEVSNNHEEERDALR